MRSPFPGMDPYLEHPALWPDVHNRLIASIADALAPLVAPRYYVGLEQRAYLLQPDDMVFVGRPDVSVVPSPAVVAEPEPPPYSAASSRNGPVWVELPMADEVSEDFIEIHDVATGKLITLLELLSPVNKINKRGRQQYLEKRSQALGTRTNFVEVDLLRDGEPMPMVGVSAHSDYRILVRRGWQHQRAQLYAFSLRQTIPGITIPLMRGEDEPPLNLNAVLHDLYGRARFDLRLDYGQPPVPPLNEQDASWARTLLSSTR